LGFNLRSDDAFTQGLNALGQPCALLAVCRMRLGSGGPPTLQVVQSPTGLRGSDLGSSRLTFDFAQTLLCFPAPLLSVSKDLFACNTVAFCHGNRCDETLDVSRCNLNLAFGCVTGGLNALLVFIQPCGLGIEFLTATLAESPSTIQFTMLRILFSSIIPVRSDNRFLNESRLSTLFNRGFVKLKLGNDALLSCGSIANSLAQCLALFGQIRVASEPE
jgi:hypothetical protein